VHLPKYGFLVHETVHRKTKSGMPQGKIRLAFFEHSKLLRPFKRKLKSQLSSLVAMQASTYPKSLLHLTNQQLLVTHYF